MCYRTSFVFSVGCKCHPNSPYISKQRYSGYLVSTFFPSPTGLSPCVAPLSRSFGSENWAEPKSYNTTSPLSRRQGIRFALLRFYSPLLTQSQLISFPGATKMLQLTPFSFLTERWKIFPAGCPIRRSPDQRLCAPTRSLSQLTTSFFDNRSRVIHQMASSQNKLCVTKNRFNFV